MGLRMKLEYPVGITVTRGHDGTFDYTATLPDIPNAIGRGYMPLHATLNVGISLDAALSGMLLNRRDIPLPSAGSPTVSPSSNLAAKVMLWQEMRRQGVGQAELARKMGKHPQYVADALLNPESKTFLHTLEQAYAALGKRLVVSME